MTSLVIAAFLIAPTILRAGFADDVKLDSFRTISVQHRQTLKTVDSWSRQMLYDITGRTTLKNSGKPELDGRSPLFTVLDIIFQPEKYAELNIIRIKNVPLRQDFALLEGISTAEKDRILREGTISLKFWNNPDVQALMVRLQSTATFKMAAIEQLHNAAMTLSQLASESLFIPVAVIPPAGSEADDHVWRGVDAFAGNIPQFVARLKEVGQTPPPAVEGYDNARIEKVAMAAKSLVESWRVGDATKVNAAIDTLVTELPAVSPAKYPSAAKRNVEVIYNRLFKLTLPGAFLYFAAFVCFLMSARAGVSSLRLWGLRLFVIGVIVHAIGIAIRWWLVAVQHGNWFDGIPIKNQFESVLMSAFFGCVIGLLIAMWRGGMISSVIGAAACFVGWLSLVAIFSAPYVFGRDIGGEISQVAGVLMSYWLYIHVTMVVASYAMIGMSFLLGLLWLWNYYKEYGTFSRMANKRVLAVDERAGFDVINVAGGTGAVSLRSTIASLFFLSRNQAVSSAKPRAAMSAENASSEFMRIIDACNVVVLQLAFWLLGVGIILGAVWADQSWGRPWGWDPKETFALVTWIVYLMVVHTRISVENKGWWTAVLSIIGFFIMLFNWVGVNFFLVGLHSYA